MLKAVGVFSTAAMVKGIIVNPLGIDLGFRTEWRDSDFGFAQGEKSVPGLSEKRLAGRER